MESSIVSSAHFKAHSGFVIPAVLLVALLGVLFGLGRLMMFRYQCRLRIDRQHEIEKQDAVKSMLNWLCVNVHENQATKYAYTNELKVVTASGREISVISVPTPVLFPSDAAYDSSSRSNHFSIATYGKIGDLAPADIASGKTGVAYYKLDNDISYAQKFGLCVIHTDDKCVPVLERTTSGGGPPGRTSTRPTTTTDRLYFPGMTNSSDHSAVSVEMSGVGGWWNDEYGRRYEVDFLQMASNTCYRIYLMRKSAHWPLANGEFALCLRFIHREREEDNEMQAFRYCGTVCTEVVSKTGGPVVRNGQGENPLSSNGPMGIQLSGRYLSIFGAKNQKYFFSDNVGYLDADVYNSFTKMGSDGGDLKIVVEVKCLEGGAALDASGTKINSITASPAYKFDIYLEYPINPTRKAKEWGLDWKLATVAQPSSSDRYHDKTVIITYDTHGTENKGFRTDEREAEKKRNRR